MSNKFLDATEEYVMELDITSEDMDILLKAHQILVREKIKKSKKGETKPGS